jgi:peptidoglycan/xylan/chitin deacetylase (PgdA/CDA1 family)
VDARTEVLKQWVDSGMTLGNHTFSHLRLFTTPLLKYQDDVIKGEVITRRLMNDHQPYQLYFRHPYTSTGPNKEVKAAFESFLRERGYKVAPFTIENSDYIFNQIYADARRNKDSTLVERLRKAYLDYNDGQFEFMERISIEMFGREISQILLIHANDINADCLDEMLNRLKARGYRFVTLDHALEDKAYETKDSI